MSFAVAAESTANASATGIPITIVHQEGSAATSDITVAIGGQADEEWTLFKRRD